MNVRNLIASALLLACASQAQASLTVPQWYEGWWDCKIDGRPSQIVWETRSVPVTTCSGDICTATYKVETNGWFREQNAAWFKLVKNASTASSIAFTYTGDNTPWFLRYNANTRTAVGNTTWQGN